MARLINLIQNDINGSRRSDALTIAREVLDEIDREINTRHARKVLGQTRRPNL
jgi:hypothetical protein